MCFSSIRVGGNKSHHSLPFHKTLCDTYPGICAVHSRVPSDRCRHRSRPAPSSPQQIILCHRDRSWAAYTDHTVLHGIPGYTHDCHSRSDHYNHCRISSSTRNSPERPSFSHIDTVWTLSWGTAGRTCGKRRNICGCRTTASFGRV